MAKEPVAPEVPKVSKYNKQGEELLDPRPVAAAIGITRPVPLGERIRQLVQNETLRRELNEAGVESFDEADDFEIPDDDTFDRTTPYEDRFDPELPGVIARYQEIKAGCVEEIPVERKKKAQECLEKHKKGPEDPVKQEK